MYTSSADGCKPNLSFLALSGAQEMQMYVCLSVKSVLERAHNIHISFSRQSQVSLWLVSSQFQVSLRSLSSYLIGQTEPKILCLVLADVIKK